MTPRPYQRACIEAVQNGFKEYRKQLVVLPTGGGKTLLFSWIAQAFLPAKTLILAHREELIDQAIAKLRAATGIRAEKEKAEASAGHSADVVVASIQTMARRLDKWPFNHFGLVVVDECHHAAADSYQGILRHFDRHAKILGVTATPDRSDRRNLGLYFENIAFEIPLFDLIHQGFLAPIKVKSMPIRIDLNSVRKVAGDYSAEDLDKAIAPWLRAIAHQIKEHASFRKTLVFLPLIATSQSFVRQCTDIGLNAEHIDGSSEDRKEVLAKFAAGEIDVLSNAMLLTEGFDDPATDCIVNCRPTRSRALYSQIIGRGTRIAPGKTDLLVLDPLWLHQQHDLIRPAHLIATTKEEALAITAAVNEDAGGQEEFDLEELQSEAQRQREEKLRRELEAKAKRQARTVDPVEFCLSIGNLATAEYEPEMDWERHPATGPQIQVLKSMGITDEGVTKGHATKLINILFARRKLKLATPKQVKYLRQFGHPSPVTCSFEDATKFLDQKFGKDKKAA